MKFEIHRTSPWDDETPPCDEAVKEPCIRVDSRTCSEEEFNRWNLGDGKLWREEGSNHRKAKRGSGCKISRDFPSEHWVVEIATLEALLAFKRKYGSNLVLRESWLNDELEAIEIDAYRE